MTYFCFQIYKAILMIYKTRSFSNLVQFSLSISLVLIIAGISFLFKDLIGYKVVALILLMTVSVIAMLFEIFPVLLAALLSSLIWNFFFIPPIFTFHITSAEDGMMFLLYFIVAFVNTVLSFKIRKEEKKARIKEQEVQQVQFFNTLLNSLSHELRTPISTIIGSVDTLQDKNIQLSESQKTELLQQIDTAGTRLNRQVENLLNMSRLESGVFKPVLDWTDSNELIINVINHFDEVQKERIFFRPNELLPLMKLDVGLIEEVVHNLIHNALKYAGDNSKISISSVFLKENWHLEVSDNGKGVEQHYIAKIFEKFYRVPNSEVGGSGLGLSIVKGFVEIHQGTIAAKPNFPKGITFAIEIPVEVSFMNNLKNE